MKIQVVQLYGKPGVSFPFSWQMQGWLAEELSSLSEPCVAFEKKYGADFVLRLYIGADTQMSDNRIKGPSIHKKSKEVEYYISLPFDVIAQSDEGLRSALAYLLSGIRHVFVLAGIDPGRLDQRTDSLIEHICSDSVMLKWPWPTRSVVQQPEPRKAMNLSSSVDGAVLPMSGAYRALDQRTLSLQRHRLRYGLFQVDIPHRKNS
jgi:hypothetical protein